KRPRKGLFLFNYTLILIKMKKYKKFNSTSNTTENHTSKSNNKNEAFFQEILSQIEQVNPADWEHYIKNPNRFLPHNAFTKKHYRRFNKLVLLIDMMLKRRNSAMYATFKQISAAGGKIKKGTKGIQIEYFSYTVTHINTGTKITIAQYNLLPEDQQASYYVASFLRLYTVFNFDDVDTTNTNITILDQHLDDPEEEFEQLNNVEEFINNIINQKQLKLKFSQNPVASYSPISDTVTMPNKEMFINSDTYYSTLFHEIIHWTGSPNRLKRFDLDASYGSEKYAKEELVAEIGSMLLCFDFLINTEFINSLRYLKGWSKSIKQDKIESFR